MTTDRRCPICNAPMVRTARESEHEFANRTFCAKSCASKSRAAKYDALLRPRQRPDPQKPGPKPAPKPNCLACGKEVATPKSKYCSIICANKHLAATRVAPERTKPPAPPKPRMATQKLCGPKPEPTGLTVIKKKPMDYPTVDPSLCAFPAKTPIWVSDGAAIVADLHAHRPICASLVRGWASTTAEGEEGYRTPCFETEAAAALWDAICDHKLGRREGRAA